MVEPIRDKQTDYTIGDNQQQSPPDAARRGKTKDTSTTASGEIKESTFTNVLSAPESAISFIEYTRQMTTFLRTFTLSMKTLDNSTLLVMAELNRLTLKQSKDLAVVINNKKNAIDKLENEDIKIKIDTLQKQLFDMQVLADEQQIRIKEMNDLDNIYKAYYLDLKKIGTVDPNGDLVIPPEKADEAKNLAVAYTAKYNNNVFDVATLNNYMRGNSQAIRDYNAATTSYNEAANNYNAFVKQYIEQNQLSEFLKSKNLTIPKADIINKTRENYDANTFSQVGSLPPITTFPSFNANDVHEGIFNSLYDEKIGVYDKQMVEYLTYWSSTLRETMDNLNSSLSINSSLMNSKGITPLFLSATVISALAMEGLGIGNTEAISSRAILEEVLENSHSAMFKKLGEVEKTQKIEELMNELSLFSLGLMNNQSVQSLFPSLSMIANVLPTLPPNSPAPALLFALSFTNRVIEGITQGVTDKAFKEFINQTPELADLTEGEKDQLAAAMELGQLLVAGKMMAENLALPDLLPQLLLFIFPTQDFKQVLSQAASDYRGEMEKTLASYKEKFINEKFSEEQAQALAETGIELSQEGFLSPNITGKISEKTINTHMLESSLTAKLIYSQNYSAEEAKKIAQQAVKRTLAEGPFSSDIAFRAELEKVLKKDFDVKNSEDVAKAVVLIAPPNPSFNQLFSSTNLDTLRQPPPASSPSTAESEPLPAIFPKEMTALIEKQILRMGAPLAQQIGQEYAKTLFGNPNPDSRDIAGVKGENALVNVINTVMLRIKTSENEKLAEASSEKFKQAILRTPVQLLLDLMDPAKLFVFTSTVFYGNRGNKTQHDVIPA